MVAARAKMTPIHVAMKMCERRRELLDPRWIIGACVLGAIGEAGTVPVLAVV